MAKVNLQESYEPRRRALLVKLRDDEYRATEHLASACGIPMSALVRGLIWRAAVKALVILADKVPACEM